MIEIKINKAGYESDSILQDIHLALKRKDVILIWGESGSGKTTLLKTIAGLIPDLEQGHFEGEIKYLSKKLTPTKLRKMVSFSFQEPEHQFILNSLEKEVFFGLDDNERKKARELIRTFGFENLLHKSLVDLSSGQRKIVSLIPSLASNRIIKIFDEPTANLDKKNIELLKNKIIEFSENSIIFIASHDFEMSKIANKFIFLNDKSLPLVVNSRKEFEAILKKREGSITERIINKSSGKCLIEIKDAGYNYPDGTRVFEKLNLKINSGDIIHVRGCNGSGKTTLLNIITNRIRPSRGSVKRYGHSKISLVMQEPEKQLFSYTLENELLLALDKIPSNIEKVNKLIAHFGLQDKRYEHPFFLSRGQKQIVLLLAVLLTRPEIIVIDEPFTGIDRKNCFKIVKILRDFYSSYNPAIIITDQEDGEINLLTNKTIDLGSNKYQLSSRVKIGEGLVHNIYSDDINIYKIAKDEFKDFHREEHFRIEKAAHEVLLSAGIPAAEVLDIEFNNDKKRYALIERIARGKHILKKDLNNDNRIKILDLLKKANTTCLEGYGPFSSEKKGIFKSWNQFITNTIQNSVRDLEKEKLIPRKEIENIKRILYSSRAEMKYSEKGKFLMMDVNPMNLFFDKRGNISEVIDIDHPLVGDPLYEYASLKMYHPEIFELYLKNNSLSLKEARKILTYELLCLISTIKWRIENRVEVNYEIEKLRKFNEIFESELVRIANVGLLVVKPECFNKIKDIREEVVRRGYVILNEFKLNGFSDVVGEFYRDGYPSETIRFFKKAYMESKFGEKFIVLILKKTPNTSLSLRNDVGGYKSYQTTKENTLRASFGLSAEYNAGNSKSTLYFNGFHKADNPVDFVKHIHLLKIDLK